MSDTIGADTAIARLTGWSKAEGARDAISKTFKFGDFTTAFAFMAGVATKAEAHDHHPEWSNVYNTVEVLLTTHDAGGVTEKDVALAEVMDRLAEALT